MNFRMEVVRCPKHPEFFCLLKTGTKPGPTKDVSFYLCNHCKFVKGTKLSPLKCQVHSDHIIELQALFLASERLWHRFRCNGRDEGKSWCGTEAAPEKDYHSRQDKTPNSSSKIKSAKGLQRDAGKSDNQNLTSTEKPRKENCDKKRAVDTLSVSVEQKSECDDVSVILISDDENDDSDIKHNNSGHSNDSLTKCLKGDERRNSNSSRPATHGKENADDEKGEENRANVSNSQKINRKISGADKSTSSDINPKETIRQPALNSLQNLKRGEFNTYRDQASPILLSSDDEDDNNKGEKRELMSSFKSVGREGKHFSDNETSNIDRKELSMYRTHGNSELDSESDSSSEESDSASGENKAPRQKSGNPNEEDKSKRKKTYRANEENESLHPKSKGQSPKGNMTVEDMNLLMKEKDKHINELKHLQASVKTAKLEFLPDKGERIHGKIKHLEESISDLNKQLSKVTLKTDDPSHSLPQKNSEPQIIKVYPSQQGSLTVHVVENPTGGVSKPQVPGKYGNSQVTVVPAHHLQQLYAAGPQAMTLYGGRMTNQRLFEVSSITKEAITKLHKQLETCPDEKSELPDPDGLKVPLMPHQRHALSWLAWREQQHPPCGILADDMGLGKTLTMISHVLKQMQAQEATATADPWMGKEKQLEKMKKAMKKSRATLIIAPASLVHQWAKEIDKRCHRGRLKYLVYHGPNRETSIHKLIDQDIVITTYTIVSREVGTDKDGNMEKPVLDEDQETAATSDEKKLEELPLLLRIGWERIILDEAHEIKNHKSIKAQSVSRLRAAYRWALTGTPIQNDLKDMYSLLRFLRFSPFDEFKVWKKHIESACGNTQRLNTIVKALLLRRTKKDSRMDGQPLVKLPSKDCQTIYVELGPEERKIYNKLFQKSRSTVRDYVNRHEDPTRGGSGRDAEPAGAVGGYDIGQGFPSSSFPTNVKSSKGGTGSQILLLLLRLRQCCCHLSLMKSHLESESLENDGIELSLEEQMKGLLIDDVLDTKESKDSTATQQSSSLFEKSSESTKLKHVMDKIKDIRKSQPGDKCVVVSQWTTMLDIVAIHLKKEGIHFSVIQGNIQAKKRADIVDDFNTSAGGAQILLVSLRAGGVGLNLIGGNHLFLLDSHWNPALEEQACDRIYRLGQKKDVDIYRFVCKDTIEEKISSLQERKLSLAKSVLSGMGSTNQKLSLNDLRLLFGV